MSQLNVGLARQRQKLLKDKQYYSAGVTIVKNQAVILVPKFICFERSSCPSLGSILSRNKDMIQKLYSYPQAENDEGGGRGNSAQLASPKSWLNHTLLLVKRKTEAHVPPTPNLNPTQARKVDKPPFRRQNGNAQGIPAKRSVHSAELREPLGLLAPQTSDKNDSHPLVVLGLVSCGCIFIALREWHTGVPS